MPLNIIIIGYGLIGPRHAKSVLQHPSTTLLALIDPSPTALTTASSLQTLSFPSLSALLSTPNIPHPDAAIICTPNHTHVPIALACLNANIHILLEKPISDGISTAVPLLRAVQGYPELKVLIGHHRRFNPYVVKMKEVVEEGLLGRVIAVTGMWTICKPDGYFAAPSEWRKEGGRGGVLGINFIHDVDLLHFLFGPVGRVYAERTIPQRSLDDPSHTAEEGAAITLRFVSGVVGTFVVCDATPAPWSFEVGTGENPLIPRVGSEDGHGFGGGFYRVVGTRGALSVPDLKRWSYDGGERGWGRKGVPFDLQLGHFVDLIEGREERVRCDVVEGLRALVVVDAVKRALEGECVVDVEDVRDVLEKMD
ncbi:quinate utilization oxidoreductase QutH [Aspergillus sclerotioniger CBS 115572]|uniref:Quinate utilization oxidoreductase QutH n=1 Tax=Aspergillus sclerotioniger CBS 115572 TaxID=1450535 RepID=A0A317XGE6_9EURO|nr:quinate utilization oxidoreductase QutH [Aspergillus sclerotioniger CBS 115572]PWY95950.1 quinate utilization oxidoreductase QutH [Aspergillus sclerotioniger CBS 115572]